MTRFDVSVVIGFRDWGAKRIRRSARSIFDSFGPSNGEVIISDYGSADPEPARRVARELGAKYVFTPGDTVWSRSRALNAGFAIAEGDIYISTDADMLFSPNAMHRIVETAREAEHCALFLQCRDLPSSMGDAYFSTNETIDWQELEKAGRLRPRWGMGGMMAIPAAGCMKIRGFDERLHTYGGEDLDFAQRARRAGYRTVWVDEPEVRMYHMWHPPTLRSVEQTEAGREAVKFNKDVVYNDKSFTRNTTNWRFPPVDAPPVVSIVYATRNRSELLKESIRSALIQTVQDFEILIVDDGSADDSTEQVALSFDDPRIRYIRQDHKGISSARNFALDQSRGFYTAVMDDDDLMPPRRLEWQLNAVTAGFVGSAGSFVNFDDETGETEVIVSRIPTLAQAADKGGAPGHGTWLIRTDVMRSIRYDESIKSGVDNNFFLRLLRSGYKISHSGKPVLLRRRHKKQVTALDSTNQSDSAKQALQYFQFGLSNWHKTKLAEEAKQNAYPAIADREAYAHMIDAYLPDHLITRHASVELESVPESLPQFDGESMVRSVTKNGVVLNSHLTVKHASYSDMVSMARLGLNLTTEIQGTSPTTDSGQLQWELEAVANYLHETPKGSIIEVQRVTNVEVINDDEQFYFFGIGDTQQIISMSHSEELSPEAPTRWLLIGCDAEEYLA
ncbi:glycosyltransferase family 2 protein [Brevibacterium aurantiacum]|uniref:Glycosyltransferase like family 2 n=1 Tax=Brevibacterium aurantiacum TaxID=273384 RepID=A0A2H1KT33_BREAU|nr:glycosyltransferase [Brevibacterium aurantiacum]SMY02831.1 Glycosyltransferase like family 2 [Brevibacterium aurantiacum]